MKKWEEGQRVWGGGGGGGKRGGKGRWEEGQVCGRCCCEVRCMQSGTNKAVLDLA